MTEQRIVSGIISFLSKPKITARGLIRLLQPCFEVHILEEPSSPRLDEGVKDDGFFRIALDLWSEDQPFATTICESYGTNSLWILSDRHGEDPYSFTAAMRGKLANANARRIILSFDYWETEERTSALIQTAIEWAESNLGSVQDDPIDNAVQRRSAINPSRKSAQIPWGMIATLFANGEDAHAGLAFMRDIDQPG